MDSEVISTDPAGTDRISTSTSSSSSFQDDRWMSIGMPSGLTITAGRPALLGTFSTPFDRRRGSATPRARSIAMTESSSPPNLLVCQSVVITPLPSAVTFRTFFRPFGVYGASPNTDTASPADPRAPLSMTMVSLYPGTASWLRYTPPRKKSHGSDKKLVRFAVIKTPSVPVSGIPGMANSLALNADMGI